MTNSSQKSTWQTRYEQRQLSIEQKTSLKPAAVQGHVDRNVIMTNLGDKHHVHGRQALNEHNLKEGKDVGRASGDLDVEVENGDFAVKNWGDLSKDAKDKLSKEMCEHEQKQLNNNPDNSIEFKVDHTRSLKGGPGFEAKVSATDKATGNIVFEKAKVEMIYVEKSTAPKETVPIEDPGTGEIKDVSCHTREAIVANKLYVTDTNENPDKNPRTKDGYDIAESKDSCDSQKLAEAQKLVYEEHGKEMPPEPPKENPLWESRLAKDVPDSKYTYAEISDKFKQAAESAWETSQQPVDKPIPPSPTPSPPSPPPSPPSPPPAPPTPPPSPPTPGPSGGGGFGPSGGF
jgi:hypothetical protein